MEETKRHYVLSEGAIQARIKGAHSLKPHKNIFGDCDKNKILEMYFVQKFSFREIGKQLNWHKNKVKRFLLSQNIELRKGYIKTQEHINKVKQAITGRILSEETKKKISESKLGNIPWNKGLKCPYITKSKTGKLRPDMIGNTHGFVSGHKTWNKGMTAKNNPKIANMIMKGLKSASTFPNKFEQAACDYINTFFDNKFILSGNGKLLINGKSPDAISEELKTIILFNGKRWHLHKYGLEATEKNKRIREWIEAEQFLLAGYSVIFIWSDDFAKNKNPKNKIFVTYTPPPEWFIRDLYGL